MKKLLLFLLLTATAFAEEPYTYQGLSFNKGMNSAAGNFLAGEEPIDVTNALRDAQGFLYPRNAFKLFNGRTRILGVTGIGGMFRYVRRADYPLFTAQSTFLVADSQFIWQDSSITDTLLGFKKRPIGTTRGQAATTSGSKRVIGSSVPKWLQYVIPKDPFMGGIIDSSTYFQIGGRTFIKVDYVLSDDTLLLNANADSTSGANPIQKLYPALDIGSQKFFTGNSNVVLFGDSTKPVSIFDGGKCPVSFVADSGQIYTATTTRLFDQTKAWFPNQWRGYWVRFAHRIMQDWGGAAGADSVVRSPWVPIVSNDDTSLTLRFDPKYGDGGATYYIMALPVERISSEYTITSSSSDSIFRATGTGFNFADADAAITSYPLSMLIAAWGSPFGVAPLPELNMISGVHGDSILLSDEKSFINMTAGTRFFLIENTPVIPYFITSHQDRMWYVDQSNPNRVYYSEPLQPGNVGPFNYIDVMPRDGDAITTLSSYNDQLLAYKNNSIARIVGDNPSNFVALPFLENLGTPGINTRTSFAGDEYFYDKNSGIYQLREFNPVRLSDPIKPLLDSIPSASAKNAAMAHFKDHLWFSYPAGANQSKNNRLITYNTRIQEPTWARHTFNRVANFAVWPLAGDSSRLTVGDPDSGLVYVYNDTARIDAYQTNRIKMTYKTGWLSLSTPELRKQLRGFQLAFDADTITGAAVDVDTMLIYKDQSATPFDTLLFNREGQLNNYVAKDVNRNGLGRFFQLEMRVAPRSLFKLYAARYKFANVGERQ